MNTKSEPIFKPAKQAFEDAIKACRLSSKSKDPQYAGNYMYMGTWNDKDQFKHIDTRQYIQ